MSQVRKYYISILTLVLLTCLPFVSWSKDFTLVIDAGHGGHDYGALGSTTNEKTINLGVALKLGKLVSSKMNDVKVIYTRQTDKYLTLQERANLANKAGGDLFISIHTNSVDKKSKNRTTVKGSATYTLGLHKTEDNLDVAKRENSVIALESDYAKKYQDFDPSSTESYVIFEIYQNKHVQQSVDFASRVQKEFVRNAGRTDNGVRQAGFWVLAKTSMPSVLVELDFICNPTQEAFLGSEEGQTKMAESIYNAFKSYKVSEEGKVTKFKNVTPSKRNELSGEKKVEPAKVTSITENNDKATFKNNRLSTKRRSKVNTTSKDRVNDKKNVTEIQEISKSDFPKGKTVYKIQFLTSVKKLTTKSSEFKGLSPVSYYNDNGLYKYTYGETTSRDEALKMLKEVKTKFKEAFVIPFKNGKRQKAE